MKLKKITNLLAHGLSFDP